MRMHKFKAHPDGSTAREWYIDLDAIHSVAADPLNPMRSIIATPTPGFLTVLMPLDDVLALISPPAAPDGYEEELAKTGLTKRQVEDVKLFVAPPHRCPECGCLEGYLHDPACGELARIKREVEAKSPEGDPLDETGTGVLLKAHWKRHLGNALRDSTEDDFYQRGKHIVAAARLDELERTMAALLGRSEAFWPLWAKEMLEKRRHDISMGKF